MKLLGEYQNGNYSVKIYDDGTKIRENDFNFFEPEYPESMDMKITNACDMMCPFCHEASVPNGEYGDILNLPFLDTLLPYTELAIGGGNPLSHPDLISFLHSLKKRKLIANMTVNQAHFLKNIPLLLELAEQELIYGLGISYISGTSADQTLKLVSEVARFPNAVFHVINGVVTVDELEHLSSVNSKVLILGYKEFRRGVDNYNACGEAIKRNQRELYYALPLIVRDRWFDVVSFDNLAVKQLDVKRLVSPSAWKEQYMGDDGSFTMYVDAVNREYAVCSVAEERYPLLDDIKKMFQTVRGDAENALFKSVDK
ncbi:hypothetical protein [Acutalibacter sp.]|jgi:hypothetical protein|uniref:hypothetical protein n=1 Tax=Acutalibacter sp. TaxID=1918636 RepID=UPI00216EBDD1|nr:radical SAM protein [Acutalibacter sp.]